MLLSVAIIVPHTSFVQAKSSDEVKLTQEYSVTRNYEKIDSQLEGHTFVRCNEPITEEYNGQRRILLGYYIPKTELNKTQSTQSTQSKQSKQSSKLQSSGFREYDIWKVYDEGIVKEWSYLSKPYFIKSIAKGMTYEKTKTISATISASYEGKWPGSSKTAANKAFNISGSGTKSVSEKIILSGPQSRYSSRDFYYQKGRNTHQINIVQEHRTNWDGILWTKSYYTKMGIPAIRTYSVDR